MHGKLMTKLELAGCSSALSRTPYQRGKGHRECGWIGKGEVGFQVSTRDLMLMVVAENQEPNKTVPSSFFSLPLSFSDPEELFVHTDDHYGVMQLCSH